MSHSLRAVVTHALQSFASSYTRRSLLEKTLGIHAGLRNEIPRLSIHNMSLPPLSSIADALLKSKDGQEIKASTLWDKQPVFVYCIRRPGCVLCRDEALKIWNAHEELEAAGLRVVCVVHEWVEREINAFVPEYWGGEIYQDVDKAFYKVFGDGQLRTGSVLSMLNPLHPVWGRIMAARKNVKDSNLSGEASILGGLLVVAAREGGIKYRHAETTFGEFPPTDEVIAAAKKAAVGAS